MTNKKKCLLNEIFTKIFQFPIETIAKTKSCTVWNYMKKTQTTASFQWDSI